MQSPRLNLVVIRASDLDASVAFYTVLGLAFTKERHGTGPEHYACQQDGVVFEIYPPKKDTSETAPVRIGFEVFSVDDAIAAASALGAKIVSPPSDSAWGRRAVLSDPDGHKVELVQRLT